MQRSGLYFFAFACMMILLSMSFFNIHADPSGYDAHSTVTRTAARQQMVIENTTVIDRDNWTITEDIIVKSGGELIINDTDVAFDIDERVIGVVVEDGGMLSIYNSKITSYSSYFSPFGYYIIVNGRIAVVDSNISFAGMNRAYLQTAFQSNGIELEKATGYFKNSTFYYIYNIAAGNSTVSIINSTFNMNAAGLKMSKTQLTLDNCVFTVGFGMGYKGDIWLSQCYDFRITDSIFRSGYRRNNMLSDKNIGISVLNCSGLIQNCDFIEKERGISIEDIGTSLETRFGPYRIDGCRFDTVREGIYGAFCTIDVANSTFDYPTDPFDETVDPDNKHNFGISILFGDLTLIDSSFDKCSLGVITSSGDLEVYNSTFTGSGTGISTVLSNFRGDNITAADNSIGMALISKEMYLSNSTLMNNENGLMLSVFYENTVLENNRIVNNTHWGIIADGTADWISFRGDNFPAPAGEPANGIGNLVDLRMFTVYARDGHGNPISGLNVSIYSGCMDKYNPNDEILVFNESRTDIYGKCPLTNLFSYVMIDGYSKIYCEEYTLRAWIKLTDDITLEQNVKVDMKNAVNHTFIFELPNFYFDPDELLLDPGEVVSGETLTVSAILHYTGPANVSMPAVDVSLLIDGVTIDTREITGISGNTSRELTFTWNAESDVPLPNSVRERLVKVMVDVPEGLEYGTAENYFNNIVSDYVEIEPKDTGEEALLVSDSPLLALLFLCLICIPILILVIFVWLRHRKKKRLQKEAAEAKPTDTALEE